MDFQVRQYRSQQSNALLFTTECTAQIMTYIVRNENNLSWKKKSKNRIWFGYDTLYCFWLSNSNIHFMTNYRWFLLKKLKLHIICCISNVPQHVHWWTHTFHRPLFYIHLNVLGFAHSGTTSSDLEAIALNVMHFNFTVANLQKALSIWLQMEKMHTADSIASTHRTGLALKLTLSEWKTARLCLTCSFPSATSAPTWAQWLGKSYHATVKAPSTRVCSVGRFFVLVLSSLLPLLPASGQSNNDSNTPHICTNNMITANLHYKCMEYMQIICNGVRDMCANDSCLPAPLLPSRTIMPARSSFPKLALAHFLVLAWPVPHSACQRRLFISCLVFVWSLEPMKPNVEKTSMETGRMLSFFLILNFVF